MLRYYRIAIWAPIALPATLWAGTARFGLPIWDPVAQVVSSIIVSGAYGAIPYTVLALWATWRIRSLDEGAIRRLAWQAPCLMLIPFLPFALIVGALDGEVSGGLALFGIGGLYIIVLGYGYVVGTLIVRRAVLARQRVRVTVRAV